MWDVWLVNLITSAFPKLLMKNFLKTITCSGFTYLAIVVVLAVLADPFAGRFAGAFVLCWTALISAVVMLMIAMAEDGHHRRGLIIAVARWTGIFLAFLIPHSLIFAVILTSGLHFWTSSDLLQFAIIEVVIGIMPIVLGSALYRATRYSRFTVCPVQSAA